jgi:uncharacterized Tic20 family protein
VSSEKNNEPENDIALEIAAVADAGVETSDLPKGDHTMAMFCHLLGFVGFFGIPFGGILGPLVLWLVKKGQDPFVDATGKEVLNFQISAMIYGIVCGLLVFVLIGIFLLLILIIAIVVYTILGAIKANEGQLYRYPFTIRFIK